MVNNRDFDAWRAEKLGYVYFSRMDELIINEPNLKDDLFDYLIDVGESHKQTGRLFGVQVKPIAGEVDNKTLREHYKNVAIPSLLVLFDNKTDQGYFKWIKKPAQNGSLSFEAPKYEVKQLDEHSLNQIVAAVKDWYALQHVA